MSRTKPPILSEEAINKAWDDAFDKPVMLDHKPTADEILTIRLRMVAQAQRDTDIKFYEAKLGKMAFLLDDNVIVSGSAKEDHEIAENMRDVWKSQRSGAE